VSPTSNELLTPELGNPPPLLTSQVFTPAQTEAPVVPELLTPEQLQKFGQDQDVANAQARLDAAMAAKDRGDAELAMMTLTGAKAGSGPLATRAVRAQDDAVTLAVLSARPVNAVAMERWAQHPASTAIGPDGNIKRRGIPAGYAKKGDVYVKQSPQSSLPQVSESPSPQVSPSSSPPTPRNFNLNPSGSTVVAVRNDGSTIIFNELIDLAARAVQRGVTFAQWAADTVRRLGASVRDYLESAWQAATTRTMPRMGGGRVTVRRPEGGFIPSPLHRQGEAFRVKNQILRARLTGSPLPKGFTQVLDATDNERRAVDQSSAMIGQDLQAAVEAYAKRTGTPLANVWTLVEPVMTGQPGALAGLNMLDANLAERARRARNNTDDLTDAVAQTMPAGNLRDALLNNKGQWMRRGYAAFDPESDWSFDKVTAAAKAGKLIAGKDARLILSNARAYLRAQNPTATVAEIEADMRDLMDRNTWQAALLGGTVKKAVGSLMRRKDIAPEIRALMGEETNPLHRYLQSAKFQAQLIARHHGQVAMRTIGLATGLLQPARGGVYTVEIPKEGHLWSGLGGTWTTPELMQAMENSSGILQDGNSWGGWLVKTLKVLGNEAKLNRVALNPDSWLVNVLGGFMSTVQSGDIFATGFMKHFKQKPGPADRSFASRAMEARRIISSGKTTAAASALQDAQREMLARLTEQGVIGSTLTLADIEASIPRHLLQWVAENQARDRALGAAQGAMMGQAMGRGLGLTGRVVGGAVGAVGGALAGTQNLQKWRQKVAEWTMTKPDNLFRVTGWLTNYETALASGMQPDPAAQWASERTLNTYPNYNALPAVLREFSKLGLVGSFIAFQHEVYRNTYWNIRYAVREVGSGNAAMQARGLQRLAGLTSIAALTFGGGLAAALSMTGAAGADDERNRLFRKWFGAPWEKDAVLAFDQFSPTSVSYLNTSYLLPQITLQELAQAASEGADEGQTVQRVMGRLWEQFAGTSVHLGPIMAAMMNMDRTGRKITNRPGVVGALERVDSALTTIAEPGFAEKMTRIAYAIRDAERRGRKFSVKQELLRFIGVRGTERTWDTLVKGRYSRFGGEYQGIRDDANRMLGENLPGAQVQAIEEANARIAELDAQRVEFEAAMNKLGIDPTVIRAAKKDSAFSALNPVKVRRDGKRVESAVRR
jgi:type III secretion system FlhB-like substrate exporter